MRPRGSAAAELRDAAQRGLWPLAALCRKAPLDKSLLFSQSYDEVHLAQGHRSCNSLYLPSLLT